jgi:Nucleotidyltransferase domain
VLIATSGTCRAPCKIRCRLLLPWHGYLREGCRCSHGLFSVRMVDSRLDLVPELEELNHALATTGAVGLYVGGSIASSDYRPGVSDIDAVALVDRPPRPAAREELIALHNRLAERGHGKALHCVYVPLTDAVDPSRKHWTWAFGELFRRPLSRIARAELLADPVVIFGPRPQSWLPPMSDVELRDAAREQLAGYWTRALRKRAIWHRDVYVDLGLTVWARAEATITEGRLITKSEAIARMRERGVPGEIVDQVASRRAGVNVTISDEERETRALTVRRFLTREFALLLGPAR